MALYMCRRWSREPQEIRTPRFTRKDIEPFVTVEYREDGLDKSVAVAVIGVAMQNSDGRWEMRRLSDETRVPAQQESASRDAAEGLGNRRISQMIRRLVHAVNKLKEHCGRVYVYPMKP